MLSFRISPLYIVFLRCLRKRVVSIHTDGVLTFVGLSAVGTSPPQFTKLGLFSSQQPSQSCRAQSGVSG